MRRSFCFNDGDIYLHVIVDTNRLSEMAVVAAEHSFASSDAE